MKIPAVLKSISLIELLVIVVFIVYIALPIPTPNFLGPYIESPLGLVAILLIAIALFFYSNPILAILFILVGYTLLVRSSIVAGQTAYIQYTPTKTEREQEIKAEVAQNVNLPPLPPNTLEEEVVMQMAPIGKSEIAVFVDTTYKPVATNVKGASPI